MKKFKIAILVITFCLFLSGCGCEKRNVTYTVDFDSNGGSIVSSQTVKKGELVSRPVDPTREGYIFDDWYISETQKYDFSEKVTKDITLKAKWVIRANGDGSECVLTCPEGYELNLEDCSCKKKEDSNSNETNNSKPDSNTTTKPTGNSKVNVSSVTVSQSSLDLVVGDSVTLTASVSPSNATNKNVTWKSSNTSVVTVSNGRVTAVGAGSATITASADGKSTTVTVSVISKDASTLKKALASLSAKNLTNGNTSLSQSYEGCTISVTSNTVSSNASATVIDGSTVTTLYRPISGGSIKTVYSVTCGSESDSKTITHTIAASNYRYTAINNGVVYIIKVSGATDYTLNGNLKYRSSVDGVQTGLTNHSAGKVYKMTFDNDSSTVYEVTE